jgi:hypothetical protein
VSATGSGVSSVGGTLSGSWLSSSFDDIFVIIYLISLEYLRPMTYFRYQWIRWFYISFTGANPQTDLGAEDRRVGVERGAGGVEGNLAAVSESKHDPLRIRIETKARLYFRL